MSYVPVPLNQVQLGSPLQVDLRTPDGRLLLSRGQTLTSEAHRDMLAAHQACVSEVDARAWQKALDRSLRQMIVRGVAPEDFGQIPIPVEILDVDYFETQTIEGGWLDLQEILRGLLYQGSQAVAPLPRLLGLEQKALTLLSQDADECLFVLFQALPDLAMGYCATRSLLCGAVAALTAEKLSLTLDSQAMLMRAALVMDIGMARQQDSLACQLKAPSAMQRNIIQTHASISVAILRGFGVQDPDLLGMVLWHHEPEAARGQISEYLNLDLLSLADTLVAKMAPRFSRSAMSSLGAAKALVLDTNALNKSLRTAMASVLGFYPPGTYVQLANGELAVVISRGERATTPHVACLINADGMPLNTYLYRDTRQEGLAVRAPVPASRVNIKVSVEKVHRLRYQRGV
jgi:HD-GYP domain-containing protein (c-di-GMP phosphodiesterase class II)